MSRGNNPSGLAGVGIDIGVEVANGIAVGIDIFSWLAGVWIDIGVDVTNGVAVGAGVGVGGGIVEFNGCVSKESLIPSPSVSGLFGSVPMINS